MKRPVEIRSRRGAARRIAASLVLTLTLSTSARAEESESLASEGGVGVGAALVNLVYVPLKLAYAAGGVVLAGLTYLWTRGDGDVASSVARVSTEGDYVITPSHLKRTSDLDFSG